jgi:hypothetical protein
MKYTVFGHALSVTAVAFEQASSYELPAPEGSPPKFGGLHYPSRMPVGGRFYDRLERRVLTASQRTWKEHRSTQYHN